MMMIEYIISTYGYISLINLIHDPHLKLGIPTSSSSLLVPPKLLTITARRSPLEFKLSAVADAGLVMWVKIDFTASLVGRLLV